MAGDVGRGRHGGAMLGQPVIDVDVQREESSDSFDPPSRFLNSVPQENDSMPRAYGLPDGPSQAPCLLYHTAFPGQMIDVYV